MSESVKNYLKHFGVLFILFGLVLIAGITVQIRFRVQMSKVSTESTNTERLTTERVFDYADVLTDREENKLRKLIAKREKQTASDIVLVILNQSLADYEVEYRNNYSFAVSGYEYVMVYSDKFYEDNKFGYNKPLPLDGTTNGGDGVILVDNIYVEGSYGKCTWFGTQGKCERKYSDHMIDHLLDVVYKHIDSNPYKAYRDYINTFTYDMLGDNLADINVYTLFPLIIAALVLVIYIPAKKNQTKGKNTVDCRTYLEGAAEFPLKEDTFIRKSVSKTVHIETSSSGGGYRGGGSHGGGGHHSSGGGGSHGGGGHHR